MTDHVRFDDLDLRVEPATIRHDGSDPNTAQTVDCRRTAACSQGCCTDTCAC